jgi:hypothetical protein
LPLNTDLEESDLKTICDALSRILLYFTCFKKTKLLLKDNVIDETWIN